MKDIDLKSLESLSPKVLAKALWDHAQLDEILYGKCELLVVANEGNQVDKMIRKRIEKLSSSSQFYDWRDVRSFSVELDDILNAIVNYILPKNPTLATDLLEEFVMSDGRIIETCDDSSGWVGDSMREVVRQWGLAWERVSPRDNISLAEKVLNAFLTNDYGLRDDIFQCFAKAFDAEGIDYIEQKLKEKLKENSDDNYRHSTIRIGLKCIAEIKKDMPMYIEYATDSGKVVSGMIVDDIVKHFIAYDRAAEALDCIESYKGTKNQAYSHDALTLEANKQLGNLEAVKEGHWILLGKYLSLSDFQALLNLASEQEQLSYKAKAIKLALNYRDAMEAVLFLTEIDELGHAVKLFHEKYDQMDGDRYYTLKAIAQFFEENQSYLEAILAYRRLAESILARAKSTIYHYAVSYIKKAERLAKQVSDWKGCRTSLEFINKVREKHKLKRAFWVKYEGK